MSTLHIILTLHTWLAILNTLAHCMLYVVIFPHGKLYILRCVWCLDHLTAFNIYCKLDRYYHYCYYYYCYYYYYFVQLYRQSIIILWTCYPHRERVRATRVLATWSHGDQHTTRARPRYPWLQHGERTLRSAPDHRLAGHQLAAVWRGPFGMNGAIGVSVTYVKLAHMRYLNPE